MEDDWDLHAVVRLGCTPSPSSAAASSLMGEDGGYEPKDEAFLGMTPQVIPSEWMRKDFVVGGGGGGGGGGGELHELCRPFFASRSNLPFVLQNSCFSPVGEFGFDHLSWFEQHQHGDSAVERFDNKSSCSVRGSSGPCAAATPQSSQSKRRKNQIKKVSHVPAKSLSSDIWAWRKYGQKPIKGSPYPRGYYRCSSSKGCLARKQVERDKTDPGMFIVTYTAEHNHPAPTHRNSLAGSIRQKPAMPRDDASNNDTESKMPFSATQPCFPSSSPATTPSPEEEAAQRTSMNTESAADDEDEGDVGFSGMVISDDDDFSVGRKTIRRGRLRRFLLRSVPGELWPHFLEQQQHCSDRWAKLTELKQNHPWSGVSNNPVVHF